jgi:hypothetical protein
VHRARRLRDFSTATVRVAFRRPMSLSSSSGQRKLFFSGSLDVSAGDCVEQAVGPKLQRLARVARQSAHN